MTDDMITICGRHERAGFEMGFRAGVVVTGAVVLAVALVGWLLR